VWCDNSADHDDFCPAGYGSMGSDNSLADNFARISRNKSSIVRANASEYFTGVPVAQDE
tara:strand:- start:3584 stop:3760 length:177 start_codon:yes stop_codon:yes gene_type:complete